MSQTSKPEMIITCERNEQGNAEYVVKTPETTRDMQFVTQALPLMLVAAAFNIGETDLGCHSGCVFAGMIELAHKMFHEQNPDEYHRVVAAGLLTRATATVAEH